MKWLLPILLAAMMQCATTAVHRQFGLKERIKYPTEYRGCELLDSLVEWNDQGGVIKHVWFECRKGR